MSHNVFEKSRSPSVREEEPARSLGAIGRSAPAGTPPSHATFVHQRMRRFRSGLLQAGLFTLITVVLWWTCGWLLLATGADRLPVSISSLFVAVSVSTALLVKAGHQKPLREIGLGFDRGALRDCLLGTAGGVGIALSVLGTQWIGGWIVVEEAVSASAANAATGFAFFGTLTLLGWLVLGAAGEELLFRGYGLQQLMRATNPVVAIVGTSTLFGLLHAGNPNASRISILNTALFGCFFGLLLLHSRSVWAPFGAHFGWNLSLAATGASLSGIRMEIAGVVLGPAGSPLWSGGHYGPEASLVATIAVSFAIIVVLKLGPVKLADRSVRLWDS